MVNLGVTPVQPNDDGTALIEYEGGDAGELTIGGKLNKIASNVALGRNIAGVRWRSDGTESLKLGEAWRFASCGISEAPTTKTSEASL